MSGLWKPELARDMPGERNPLLQAALGYAARGLPVFPLHWICAGVCTCGKPKCASPGKHPRTQHGKDEATTDALKIRAWWKRWPDANVGGLTGASSGMIALDVDPPKGEDSLAAILNGDGLPPTPISRTGRGRHVLFAHPGQSVRNRAGLRPGLDVRGDGGYVVLPRHRPMREGPFTPGSTVRSTWRWRRCQRGCSS